MPKGKKGFSSGAENHRYRSTDAGAESAAVDEGGSAKRPRDSTVAGPAGQRCALPSCGVLLYNAQAVALDGESIDAAPRALCARPSLLSPF
jgi:hypothetical protein